MKNSFLQRDKIADKLINAKVRIFFLEQFILKHQYLNFWERLKFVFFKQESIAELNSKIKKRIDKL